ncbi:MAG: hypothetical protein KJ025_13435 [Burkholderiales bacterium]|nr:hypothetical protein [Burkholderiales bacterium]
MKAKNSSSGTDLAMPVASEGFRNHAKEIEMRIHWSRLRAAPLAAACAGIAGAALAAASFGDLDKDRDGYVSKVEARGDRAVEAAFNAADRNKDGRLDRSEFATIAADAAKHRSGPPASTGAPK